MATYQIGNRKTTFTPADADSTYILGKGKVVESGTSGIQQSLGLDGLTFEIAGKISTVEYGIRIGDTISPATNLAIEVARSGKVLSQTTSISAQANGYEIDNDGKISGVSGIRAAGADGRIDNDGTVTGSGSGIVTSGEVSIRNDGTIFGGQYGIVFNATEDGAGSLRNTGTIEGASAAIMGSAGDDRIVNSGTIKGDISLRDGADTFVLKGGKVTGEIGGGKGDDSYVIHELGATIKEINGEGFDFVKASVSFTLGSNIEQLNLIGKADIDATGNDQDNHLQGNSGKNQLRGEGGTDFLVGLAGNDRLFGGDGADYFNFQKGSGRDTIMDFEAGIDEIQIGGLKGATGFDDMLANHVTEKGDDLWITYGGDVVVLKNTEIGDLMTGDFVFG